MRGEGKYIYMKKGEKKEKKKRKKNRAMLPVFVPSSCFLTVPHRLNLSQPIFPLRLLERPSATRITITRVNWSQLARVAFGADSTGSRLCLLSRMEGEEEGRARYDRRRTAHIE
jgi:hypothetical protein